MSFGQIRRPAFPAGRSGVPDTRSFGEHWRCLLYMPNWGKLSLFFFHRGNHFKGKEYTDILITKFSFLGGIYSWRVDHKMCAFWYFSVKSRFTTDIEWITVSIGTQIKYCHELLSSRDNIFQHATHWMCETRCSLLFRELRWFIKDNAMIYSFQLGCFYVVWRGVNFCSSPRSAGDVYYDFIEFYGSGGSVCVMRERLC